VFNPADWIGTKIVNWLIDERDAISHPLCDYERVRYEIRPCDVLLVEGRSQVSDIIKLITQSPWSHSALYIGRVHDVDDVSLKSRILSIYKGDPDEQLIIEAWLGEGTVINPLSKYKQHNLRICRPTGLSRSDAQHVLKYALAHLGFKYDVRQLLDLARFLFPYGVIPRRWRSSLFAHNAGMPTRVVCSSMIAAAFASVSFPILPVLERREDGSISILHRNASLYTPRDFDYSPYFDIIKCPYTDFGNKTAYRNLPWDRHGRIYDGNGNCYIPGENDSGQIPEKVDGLSAQNAWDAEPVEYPSNQERSKQPR